MKRRELAQVAAGTALAHSIVTVLGCGAQPAAKTADPHAGHHGHGDKTSEVKPTPVSSAMGDVAAKTAACVVVGETCLEHCIRSLSTGDKMMADCARVVQQMLAVCRAMSSLTAMGSEYALQMKDICKKSCGACALECEKHAHHHTECKACFEACKATLQALDSLA